MKPNAMNRLEKLEWSNGQKGNRIQCIERVGVTPGRGQCDPLFYRDSLGNLWSRDRSESAEAFRERVTRDAIAKARPKVARILGYENLAEAMGVRKAGYA